MPFLDTGRPAPDAATGGSGLNPRVVWLLGRAKAVSERAQERSASPTLNDAADAVLSQIERLEVQKARLEGRLVDAYAALHSVEEQQLARLTTTSPVPITADQVVAQEIACATGVGATEVARRLELATAPRRHRVLRERLRAGAVSLQRALRVVVETRALGDDVLPDLEVTVLAPAPDGSVASQRLFATRLQRCVRSADSRPAEERRRSSRLRRTAYGRLVEDGMGMFTVVAPAERVVGVLDRVDALARVARAGGDDRSLDQLRSDLLCDLALFGVVPSAAGAGLGGEQGPTYMGLLSDAAPASVRVVVPFEVAVGMSHAACELPGHGWVTAAHARQIMTAPGSVWQRLAVDVDTGRALELSTDCYRPTAAMIEHVRAVDGVCRAPGCQVPADRCDVDHLVPWPVGRTHVSNLDSLSRGCHNGKTAGVWQVERVDDAGISWSSLAGRDYVTYPKDWREALRDPGSGPPPGPPSAAEPLAAEPADDPPPF
ncbi:HNH endonuclease signature motif containing protein [Terracoccus sp. 273MFTsu3.1]|uniref:HNH endonuclease signature motif containing protein n=1 Tax=Terracoccus sp. 273MFTsu3.1 TaxID=1172188 RepID=UPI0003649DD0|nr:HNH endonuclease signature motif containing protein [Terracoccus sp. 273MFTsu3.1]